MSPTVGNVSFPTSCDAAAQGEFEAAVAMLHSFWFEEAQAAFESVAERDPECAMAYWGIAMTQWGNPMTRAAPSPERVAVAREALSAAEDVSREVTHREQMYLDAAEVLYAGDTPAALLEGLREHEARMREIMEAHPDDPEAAIFYARAVIGNAPPDDLTYSRQLHAAEVMEPLFEERPNHPGLAHYLIHAFDAPAIADEGADAAFRYADIAPDAPHALHMPTHIFTRLGYWEESIDLNARSAEASPYPDAAVHPLDYMVYAYLQLGRDQEAAGVVERAESISDEYYGGLIGYNFAAMEARYALERERWSEAASLSVPDGALPYVQAVTRFARAVGAARSGSPDAAAAEIRALAELRDELRAQNDAYWSTVVEAQRLASAAWEARARGRDGEAVRLATDAADLEATVEKHPVTPGPILPARELLGDLLLELDRPAEARIAYETTLETEPRRARALHGAARAAELAGDSAGARAHYEALLELMEEADPDRPERRAAVRFLDGG
ncbi:MAG: hypothetical protein R3223_06130 [Longimicrobiales bacterium]|nr:hypothetical protein [Longimicrobiales bacterium]